MKKMLIAVMFVSFFGAVYAEELLVNPPLEFNDTPVRTALDTIFLKAGNVPYSIEIPSGTEMGLVTLKLTEETALEPLLKLILEPRGLNFKKDSGGVYHIRRNQVIYEAAPVKVTKLYAFTSASEITDAIQRASEWKRRRVAPSIVENGFEYFGNTGVSGPKAPFLEPILAFKEEPFVSAAKKLFEKGGGRRYVFELSDPQSYGTVSAEWKSPVHFHKALSSVLGPKGLAFYVDGDSVYHIVDAETTPLKNLLVSYPRPEPFVFLSESEKTVFKSPNKEFYFDPPIDLSGLSAKEALKNIFKKASIYYGWLEDKKLRERMALPVSFKLEKRLELKELLKAVLEPLGLKYIECKSGNYCILDKEINLRIIAKTYALTYRSASSMVEPVRAGISPFGKVEVDEINNSLIVTDDESIFGLIENLIMNY